MNHKLSMLLILPISVLTPGINAKGQFDIPQTITFTTNAFDMNIPQILPIRGFSNFDELKQWATSSGMGGWARSVMLDNQQIYYTQRSFTSGIPTVEIIFFSEQKGILTPFLDIPCQTRELRVELKEKNGSVTAIYVKALDPKSHEFMTALTVTKWMIPTVPEWVIPK